MSVGRLTLLVLILALAVVGLAVGLMYQAMLVATIGGLIVTDWWKWIGLALVSLPIWLLYRHRSIRRRRSQ